MGNSALSAAISSQFLLQIGVFTAVPMIVVFVIENGLSQAIIGFVTMQLQLASVFFTFSLGTRSHFFSRTIVHGGAKYRSTGRGFVVRHEKFAELYRTFSRSHFTKGSVDSLTLLLSLAVANFLIFSPLTLQNGSGNASDSVLFLWLFLLHHCLHSPLHLFLVHGHFLVFCSLYLQPFWL